MIPAKASTEGDAQAGFPEEMRAACEAVRLASMICVETQRTLTSAEKVSKSDDSPVTVADFAAQALVTSVLEKSHPDIEMVAEESADDLRGDENAPLLDRVTSLVNKVLLMSTDEENGDAEADKVVRLMLNEEVADAIDAFSPQVDLTLRHLLDYLVEDERQPDDPDAAPERVYALYPAAQVVLAAKGGA